MAIIGTVLRTLLKAAISNTAVVVLSLLLLYVTLAVSDLARSCDDYKAMVWSVQGVLFSSGVMLLWLAKWKRLDKNYRSIAVFFWLVFGCFVLMNLQTLLRSLGVL